MDEYVTTTTATHTIVELPLAPAVPAPRIITAYAFRQRLTNAEKVGIYTAAESSAAIRVYLDDLATASFVNLDSPVLADGLDLLEIAGLLSSERVSEIISTEVQDYERP